MIPRVNGGIELNVVLLIIFLILLAVSGYIVDKSVFWFLKFIKYTLISTLPIILLVYIFDLLKDSKSKYPFLYMILFDLLQLLYWYMIRKKFDWDKEKDFYRDSRNPLISIPMILYNCYIIGFIWGIVEIIKAYFI